MTHQASRSIAAILVATATVWLCSVSPASAQAAGSAADSSQACIAIVMPSATGVEGDATQFSNSLRDLFASYLTGPSLRAVNLDARLSSQAIEEARQKDCGFVLLTTIARKRDDGNGWGRALGQAASSAAYYGIPYAGGTAAAAARGAAVAGAHAISTMATTTRAKDEVTLTFRVGTVDTVMRTSPKTEKAKAKNNGEDLLTPLVEKASESIAATVLKK